MAMHRPPHPGKAVRVDCLEPFKLTVSEAARLLGVSRQALSNLVNERSAVSPEMAIRLAMAFGGTPQSWLRMQAAYDVWCARERNGDFGVTAVTAVRRLSSDFSEE